MESDKEPRAETPRTALMRGWNAKTKAENEILRAERNARRWKAERDPIEYENQKAKQRSQYAQNKTEPVRPYVKIIATTKKDHAEKQKVRDAERQQKRYSKMTPAERQAKSDLTAEFAWIERRRKKHV